MIIIAVLRTLAFVSCFLIMEQSCAQSVSDWIPIAPFSQPDSPSSRASPEYGANYINVEFITARIFQKSNWWQRISQTNRQAMIELSVTGTINGSTFQDSRTSAPIQLQSGTSFANFGFRQIVVEHIPTTYTNLQLKVRLAKTAKDGLSDLLKTLSEVSKATPALSVYQFSLGATSAAKAIGDYLFDNKLLEEKLSSTLQFPSSGTSLPAGLYAVLAGDDVNDYEAFLPTGSDNSTLKWVGSELISNGKPVDKVSYFVVRVSYTASLFPTPYNALSLARPWGTLYRLAKAKAGRPTNADEYTRMAQEVKSHFFDAQALLDADPDYIQNERDAIHKAVYREVVDIMAKRRALIVDLADDPDKASLDRRLHGLLFSSVEAECQELLALGQRRSTDQGAKRFVMAIEGSRYSAILKTSDDPNVWMQKLKDDCKGQ